MKRPTISDVAQLAGVSKSTVSHVVNSTRFVEEPTKQRVERAIDQLGYRPSSAARSLTTQQTGVIGMVISDASNLFFGKVVRGVEDVLRARDYSVMVCSTDETLEREAYYLDLLLRHRVDGIIAAATSQRWEILGQAQVQHTPVVFVDRRFEELEGTYVGVDNKHGAYLATSHLIECGYDTIGIIAGFQRLSTMRERLDGFRQALAEHDIALPDEWLIACPLTIEAGRESTRRLLSLPQRPRALFLNNNLLSLGALLALKELGLCCPDDVALVGFDDHPWSAVADPALTVIRQPARQVGQVAAEMLFALLDEKESAASQVLLDCELVVRQSSCPKRTD